MDLLEEYELDFPPTEPGKAGIKASDRVLDNRDLRKMKLLKLKAQAEAMN